MISKPQKKLTEVEAAPAAPEIDANDSVTVATETPVYIRREDVEHLENALKFKVCNDGLVEIKGKKSRCSVETLLCLRSIV